MVGGWAVRVYSDESDKKFCQEWFADDDLEAQRVAKAHRAYGAEAVILTREQAAADPLPDYVADEDEPPAEEPVVQEDAPALDEERKEDPVGKIEIRDCDFPWCKTKFEIDPTRPGRKPTKCEVHRGRMPAASGNIKVTAPRDRSAPAVKTTPVKQVVKSKPKPSKPSKPSKAVARKPLVEVAGRKFTMELSMDDIRNAVEQLLHDEIPGIEVLDVTAVLCEDNADDEIKTELDTIVVDKFLVSCVLPTKR